MATYGEPPPFRSDALTGTWSQGRPPATFYRFRDKDLGDATGLLVALVYFFVAASVSGYPAGTPFLPFPWVFGSMFLSLGVLYFALGNYAFRHGDPRLSVPVVLNIGAYLLVAIVALLLYPSAFWVFLVFLGVGMLMMLGVSIYDLDNGTTRIRLVAGMVGTLILGTLVSAFVGVALQVGPDILTQPVPIILIAVAMFLATVFSDWMETPGGVVGYFGGTDAVFYAFTLTSFFIMLGTFELFGWP